MDALELVRLTRLMQLTSGRAEIAVALIDGPVSMDPPELWSANVAHVTGKVPAACSQPSSTACAHGTYVAGILSGRRASAAPGICPGCTLLIRAIFPENTPSAHGIPSAAPAELAGAILDAVDAGARIINLSLSVASRSAGDQRQLETVLSYAAARGVIVVSAAGNQAAVGGSFLCRHSWPIPVAGSDAHGRPAAISNLGNSIGLRGLMAPSENIASVGPEGRLETFSGTSAAAPFVSGAIALLWSEFPAASASAIKLAILGNNRPARRAIVPPLLDAWAAYKTLGGGAGGRRPS